MTDVEVRWTRTDRPVRVLSAGRRTAAAELVVVPGLGAPGYLLPLVRACAQRTRVHLLDVPGFGDRSTAGRPADLTAVARTTADWLRQEVEAPVHLLGHSTGAQAAARAALAVPDRVSRVVLAVATIPPRLRRVLPLAAAVARTLPHEQPGQLPAVLPSYARGLRTGGLAALLRSALADRLEDVVPHLQPPVLVLRGRHDGLCPHDWAAHLASRAPRGRLAVVPGGHDAVWRHADAVARLLAAQRSPDDLRESATGTGSPG